MKTLTIRQKSASGLALLSAGLLCMSASIALPHFGLSPNWTLAIGSIHLSLDFFHGFLIGLQLVLQLAGIVILLVAVRERTSERFPTRLTPPV